MTQWVNESINQSTNDGRTTTRTRKSEENFFIAISASRIEQQLANNKLYVRPVRGPDADWLIESFERRKIAANSYLTELRF